MKSSNLLLPVQKIQLIQYQSKTPFQKFLLIIQFYIHWIKEWSYYWLMKSKQSMIEFVNEFVNDTNIIIEKMSGIQIINKSNKKNTFYIERNVPETINQFMMNEYKRWEALALKVVISRNDNIKNLCIGNGNIDECYYDEKQFKDVYMESILQENKEMEKKWESKIMMTWVPMIGNVIMYYDFYKMAFCYFCDTDGVNYNIMNACVMKYVMSFQCMDLFVDELIYISGEQDEPKIAWTTPLLKIQKIIDDFHLDIDDEVPNHRDIYSKPVLQSSNSKKGIELFAKFKQYRTEPINKETIKIRNKIIYKGRIREFKTCEKKCVFVRVKEPVKEPVNKDYEKKIKNIMYQNWDDDNEGEESEKEGEEGEESEESEESEKEGEEEYGEEGEEEYGEEGEEGEKEGEEEYGEESAENEEEKEQDNKINISIDELLYANRSKTLLDWKTIKEMDENENNNNNNNKISYKYFKNLKA